jgi:hypothetical protein
MQGIDESTLFAPHVRGEIGAFGWHAVEQLPATWEESKQLFVNEHGGRHKFFNVWPYIRPLRAWIGKRRRKERKVGVAAPQSVVIGSKTMVNFKFDRAAILEQLGTVGSV